MGMSRPAVDPSNPFQVNSQRRHLQVIAPGSVVYAFRGDLTKEFTNVFQAWCRAGGEKPPKMQVDKILPMQAAKGNHCVHAMGQMDPDGKGMQAFDDMMCAMDPIPSFGGYSVLLDHALLPTAIADKEKDQMTAIIVTYKVNEEVVKRQIAQQVQQKQQSDQQIMNSAQQYIGQIHQIGAQATARMNATEAANDAQHAAWNQQENKISQNGQGATTCSTNRWCRTTMLAAPAQRATPRSGTRPPTPSSRLTPTSTRSLTRRTTGRVSITNPLIWET
jgi:hypothetical protein